MKDIQLRKLEVKRTWASPAPRGKSSANKLKFFVNLCKRDLNIAYLWKSSSICLTEPGVCIPWHFYRVFCFYFRSTARIGTLLEQLQKLCLAGSEAKYEQDKIDVEQLRYVTNKIQQLLSSQGNDYPALYGRMNCPTDFYNRIQIN